MDSTVFLSMISNLGVSPNTELVFIIDTGVTPYAHLKGNLKAINQDSCDPNQFILQVNLLEPLGTAPIGSLLYLFTANIIGMAINANASPGFGTTNYTIGDPINSPPLQSNLLIFVSVPGTNLNIIYGSLSGNVDQVGCLPFYVLTLSQDYQFLPSGSTIAVPRWAIIGLVGLSGGSPS